MLLVAGLWSAVFGGEHSAHYYFRDFFNADTGMLAAMHVLAALGGQEQPLSELAEEYEPYVASGEINSQVEDKDAAVAAVVAQFAPAVGEGVGEGRAVHEDFAGVATTVTRMDGTTVAAQDGTWWFNLRPSNTEPFLRYNGEARTAATMEALRDAVLAIVRAER